MRFLVLITLMLLPDSVFSVTGKLLVDSLIYVHCKVASSELLALATCLN